MKFSKVDICNIALTSCGQPSIQALEDRNTAAQTCRVLVDVAVLRCLELLDWPFARRFKRLQEVSDPVYVETGTDFLGVYTYQLPSDCLAPRELYPEGHKDSWKQVGQYLQCSLPYEAGVYLYYTTSEVTTADFPQSFTVLCAAVLATMIVMPLTRDPKLKATLTEDLNTAVTEAISTAANIGVEQPGYDDNPAYDSFVNID